jgi:hypothetical protein
MPVNHIVRMIKQIQIVATKSPIALIQSNSTEIIPVHPPAALFDPTSGTKLTLDFRIFDIDTNKKCIGQNRHMTCHRRNKAV